MRSGNPSLRENTFDDYRGWSQGNTMTIQGTVNKTFILLLLVVLSAVYTWYQYFSGVDVTAYLLIGAIGGFIVSLIATFWKQSTPITAPVYALLEGLFVGGISALYEAQFQGITTLAVTLTFAVLFSLLIIYKLRIIKVTQNFRLGLFAATFGILLTYLINIILSFFGVSVPFLHDSGPIGILISLFIVVIAALNLVLDFDFIEKGAQMNCPKYLEWYGAFGLMVTLVWLYLEILRLLSKVMSRK
ncbi:Bax inhibitor-1/YccA family protein [Caldibacillus lycopersici]|uniref:Bax inhibitor-1/YccA family protein n=1 Tax=Perspicuibacillus lycopersici TaxID=1325689 RepID=A0AAE3LNX8_9BACI|nr:Bax inhibitor-1/YccA family protein [Perspicuibacillus lycopersici]MCU9614337.1 Bax inhibitor-1/YccA family protein [Perspicuibacillus lycopersici]